MKKAKERKSKGKAKAELVPRNNTNTPTIDCDPRKFLIEYNYSF